MRIERIDTLQADAGGRTFDYLKITADSGLKGWSEFNESFGGAGLSAVITKLAPTIVGKDPRNYEAHVALMQALRRTAAGVMVPVGRSRAVDVAPATDVVDRSSTAGGGWLGSKLFRPMNPSTAWASGAGWEAIAFEFAVTPELPVT